MSHPIHSRNADVCCRWLCVSAGKRSRADEREIENALNALPHQGKALPTSLFPAIEVTP